MIGEIFEEAIKLIPFGSIIKSGVNGYVDMANTFGKNYAKRRHVGYTIGEALSYGYNETKSYMHAKWTGIEFHETIPAFTYVNGIENNDD